MCFHTSNTKSAERIEKRFQANYTNAKAYEPYYHRAAYEDKFFYIIRQNEHTSICPAYWGLMPEDININERRSFLKKHHTYNARTERLFSSTLYNKFIHQQRCLIISDGFFEPHKVLGKTIPYYCKHQDHSLFAFAGFYSEPEDGAYTATIITNVANTFFEKIHNVKKQGTFRMPLVLDPSAENEWLNTNLNESNIKTLTSSFTSKAFVAYPVSRDINYANKHTNHKEILNQVHYPELDQLRLF